MSNPSKQTNPSPHPRVESDNSGSYDPGPTDQRELSIVQASENYLQLEEFPDGPYGAATNAERLGKSTPWKPGQVSVSAYRDASLISSDRKVAMDEPEADAPRGTIEGQN